MKKFRLGEALLILRIALGVLFLLSGITKAMSGFTAANYLQAATGPLSSIFTTMAGNPVVDFLVIFGEIGIGLALLAGILVTFASASGMLMMMLFYLSQPPTANPINDQIIYALCFLVFIAQEKS